MSTAAVHAGWDASDPHGSVVPPIYATSAYAHTSHASLCALFAREAGLSIIDQMQPWCS